MALQAVRNVFDLMWDQKRSYGDVRLQDELERSKYAFDYCDVEFLQNQFNAIERECKRTISAGLVLPAYDYALQLSNIFNLLDSRGAVGVTERQRFLGRTRDLAKEIAALYVRQREEMGYPWLRHTKESAAEIENNKVANIPPAAKNDARPSNALLEIGVEELPANNVSEGKSQLEKIVPVMLKEARLDHGDLKVLATPRRLAVLIKDVAPRQNAVDEMVKGPGVKIAFDKEGNPTQAAVAFAKRFNTDVKELVVVEDGKSSYVYAKRREEGKPAVDVLASLLPQIIGKLSFEKTMRWNASQVAFPRPIQWLVALFGAQPIKFQYAGARSGATSYGSRGERAPKFEIPSADDYHTLLNKHQIIADVDLRRAEIMRQIDAAAASIEARVEPDDDLLDEVTNLVEQPVALLASFDESFLEMPSVILKKVMRSKQRYFTLLDAHTGAMRPNFITIRNGPAHNSSKVIIGNENVVYARFADAAYFYRYDIERPLESLLPKLDTLTFQAKLGSMLDKTRRIESLIGTIGAQLKAQNTEIETASQAAHLCKADLVTKMVVEMTSLQGVMGRIYHLRQGGAPAVADAIFEHYLPRFAGDDSPKSTPGLIVALADKLDSIAGLFAVGLEPKGNADPFALRRAAIGVVQGLVDNAAATFSLRQALTAVRGSLPAPMSDNAFEAALRFIIGRQRASLLEAGHRHDIVEAVVNVKGEIPYEAQRFVEQLRQIVKRDDWPALLAAYSRCARIIKSSGVPAEDISAVDINDVEPATHRLSEKLSSLTRPGDINELAAFLASIEPLITDFFNKVLVNAEDPGLRRMRLSLVSRVVELANGIVDFSKVEGF